MPGRSWRCWSKGPARRGPVATALVRENAALERENATLRDRIAELKRSAALDSTTSSKPPASDGLRKKSGTQRRTRSQRGKSATPSGGHPSSSDFSPMMRPAPPTWRKPAGETALPARTAARRESRSTLKTALASCAAASAARTPG